MTSGGRQVIVHDAAPARQYAPFVFESKPYERVGSTTTVMSQEEYSRLLLDRNYSRHRWENQPAVGVRLEDLDREEILRTRQPAIEQRRLSAGTTIPDKPRSSKQQYRITEAGRAAVTIARKP